MAEVMSKSIAFSTVSHHHNHDKVRIFPVSCSFPAKNKENIVGFSLKSDFNGLKLAINQNDDRILYSKKGNSQAVGAKMGLSIGKAHKWWEKGLQPNMKEITSAEELVDSLLKAGDNLVIVDFFSPGCGGCKALHPKICQFAEMNPDIQFLQINYEEHKSMCYSLGVHVLPFFRFYRGAQGRVCSFSCTNATIKKFKDALAKHSPARCSLGPPKGLEEKELIALSANKDLSFTYTPKPVEPEPTPIHQESDATAATSKANLSHPSTNLRSSQDIEDKTLVTAGR